jgi:hypothetical protein
MDGDVWPRLKRLDQCCDVHISNSPAGRGNGWSARVSTRAKPSESFEVTGATVLDAVQRLVDEAERRGWPAH